MQDKKLILLNKKNYNILEKHFEINKLSLKSIINHNTSGIIYVDSLDNPKIALVWDCAHYIFILGNVIDDDLLISIKDVIFNQFFNGKKSGDDILDFEIDCPSKATEYNIKKIFKGHPVMFNQRRYYSLDFSIDILMENDPEFLKQNELAIHKIDEKLLAQSELINLEDIENWIKENWISTETFLLNGLGICIVKDKTIASWSLMDYNVNDICEIGIETDDDFRKQGLATYLVQEILKCCKEMKIKKVGWDCREDNIASYKLAEKVGFTKQYNYNCYHGWYNKIDNYLINGYYYLYIDGNYNKSIQYYERAFTTFYEESSIAKSSTILNKESSKKWYYYDMACCYALIEEVDKAMSNITKAINAGWTDMNMLENDKRLKSLHIDQRWIAILNNAK